MRDKIIQFGIYHFVRRSVLFFIKPFFEYEKYVVFEMPDFNPSTVCLGDVTRLDTCQINRLKGSGGINDSDAVVFQSMISSGETGIGIEREGILVGSAWVQTTGIYRFGRGLQMMIPEHVIVMKNLFVSPSSRGSGLGKILNSERLALVPDGCVPVVFIIYDNRIAINNWMAYGFSPALNVWTYRLFGRYRKMLVRRLSDSITAIKIEQSLTAEAV